DARGRRRRACVDLPRILQAPHRSTRARTDRPAVEPEGPAGAHPGLHGQGGRASAGRLHARAKTTGHGGAGRWPGRRSAGRHALRPRRRRGPRQGHRVSRGDLDRGGGPAALGMAGAERSCVVRPADSRRSAGGSYVHDHGPLRASHPHRAGMQRSFAMRQPTILAWTSFLSLVGTVTCLPVAEAAPTVSRLTPPSELFSAGQPEPIISRFFVGQKFDLQATIRTDADRTITGFEFSVDGDPVHLTARSIVPVTTGGKPGSVVSVRGYENSKPGVHVFTVTATQSDGQTVSAKGNFEIVGPLALGPKAKNIIIMLGDGMGAGHRTAARMVQFGVAQGKARGRLAMDSLPVTASIMTSSLNSIVTDSAPGMSNYVTGNKANNNQEGVFPDYTLDKFDNPRVEYLAEYLARTQGKKLGIVTTADVFDATPAALAVHTQDRGAGTGIVDQYFDDRGKTGLTVLMGGGRKWFLPSPTACPDPSGRCGVATGFNGSARDNST